MFEQKQATTIESKIWIFNPRPNEWYVFEQTGSGKDATISTLGFVKTEQEAKWMMEGIKQDRLKVEGVAEVTRMFEKTRDKHSVIESILDMEIWLGQLELGKTRDRVKSLAKLKLDELELLWRDLLTTKYDWEKIVEKSVYIGLGRKVPAYLQEETAKVAKLFAPMKLLTKEIREKLPPLYSQEKVQDPMVWVKFFTPDSNWTWYGIEFDGKDIFFGWVVGFEKELGNFSLQELESARGPLGLPIERDMWFTPQPLSEVKKLHLAELAQGTMGAIGSAAITGIGIGAGFKFVDWLANKFRGGKVGALSNEKSSAGFPLDPGEEKPEDIDRFYSWTDKASGGELLNELCERADYLGAHLCLAKEGDDVDKEWIEKCPYIGTEDVYSELGRLRFLCWKLTSKLPSSVTILGDGKISLPKEVWEDASLVCMGVAGDARQREKLRGMAQNVVNYIYGLKEGEAGLKEEAPYARQVPAYVDVFATTIAKHYRPTEDFHEGSIRVVKPDTDVLVYLGCLKGDNWDAEAERCSPNPTVVKTIVPNNKKYRDELDHLKLVHPEVKINYRGKEVGVEPVVGEDEQEELKAVDEALAQAEVLD